MSKAFDEGGAKGLLLANLGVCTTGQDGCQVVFDSTLEDNADEIEKQNEEDDKDDKAGRMFDFTWFTPTLSSAVSSSSSPTTTSWPLLVPQLQSLRAENELLQSQGFIDENNTNDRGANDDHNKASRQIKVKHQYSALYRHADYTHRLVILTSFLFYNILGATIC